MPASINNTTDSNTTVVGPTIAISDARVAFDGVAAVESLDLHCNAGEFVSIVGPSGCGKSTLLRVIAGLQVLASGSMVLNGSPANDTGRGPASVEKQTGFVFQTPALLPWRNVLDNIGLPLELSGVESTERIAAAREARELVGLASDDEDKLPRKLSGGMRMRVSLARTLVTQPKIMLLDEPLAAVDDILRNELLVEMASLWQQQNWTTILVTHNVSEAVFVSQRVLVMSPRPGRIVDSVDVPFEYPRRAALRSTPEFAKLTGRISESLRGATS